MTDQKRRLSLNEAVKLYVEYTAYHERKMKEGDPVDALASFLIEKNPGVEGFNLDAPQRPRALAGCKCPACDPEQYKGFNLESLRWLANPKKKS